MSGFNHVSHKKSNIVSNTLPKAPVANDLLYGEIAVNYANSHETLFIKNSNDNIVKFSSDETFKDENSNLLLPTVTSSDNGKVLMVVDGVWTLISPSTIYSGSGVPSSSQGNNGDIYLQTE